MPEGTCTVDASRLIRFYMFLIFCCMNCALGVTFVKNNQNKARIILLNSFICESDFFKLLEYFHCVRWNWLLTCDLEFKIQIWCNIYPSVTSVQSHHFFSPRRHLCRPSICNLFGIFFAYSQNITTKTNPIKSYVPQRAIYLVKAAVV